MYILPIKPQMAPELAHLKNGDVLKYFAPVISIRCKNYKPGGANRKLSLGANFKLRISGTI